MTEFILFLRENWQFVLTCGLFLIEFIFIIVKRKPKSIDDFKLAVSDVLSKVPALVSLVERPGEGLEKKSEVKKWCKDAVEATLKRGLSDKEFLLLNSLVDQAIELVLSSPKKKEINYEK